MKTIHNLSLEHNLKRRNEEANLAKMIYARVVELSQEMHKEIHVAQQLDE